MYAQVSCSVLSHVQEVMDHHARMQFALQLSSRIKDPRKAVLSQQNKVKYVKVNEVG